MLTQGIWSADSESLLLAIGIIRQLLEAHRAFALGSQCPSVDQDLNDCLQPIHSKR